MFVYILLILSIWRINLQIQNLVETKKFVKWGLEWEIVKLDELVEASFGPFCS